LLALTGDEYRFWLEIQALAKGATLPPNT